MKKTLIITLMLMLAGTVAAQDFPTDKGSVILGGSMSFTSLGGDLYKVGDKNTTITILAPSVGYFISPNILIGGRISLVSISKGGASSSVTSFGPEVGYYFGSTDKADIKGSSYPYVKAMFLYTTDGDDNWTSFGGRVGLDYMLSNAVALDAGVTFQSDSFSPDGASGSVSGTTLMVSIGVMAFIY